MTMDLNWCKFYVHVHDLLMSRMNLGIATFIGNKLGKFHDLEMDSAGCAWGATLRMHVTIDVNHPLKRALKIRTPMGDEHLVKFTNERLPNFYYLCERLGHISKYCELQFAIDFQDPGSDSSCGPWLRAPLPTKGPVNGSNSGKPRGTGAHQ
ncbi:UNVERIFIED_CONTAM: hypothetical protein Scaly_1067900 [Sesamum calycinum]|uniref:Zinc knuckle CX2CX4HX4C domain-containing protein n=1 Tax=Sesamum calycinum TaxID=2727403 RepID=A0AAW2QL30_9LAMI